MFKRCFAVAVLVCSLAIAASAAAVESPFVVIQSPEGGTVKTNIILDGKAFQARGEGPGYIWSYEGNIDPLINWGFTASIPGAYSVSFFLPVIGGPYGTLRHQASVTISDITTPAGTFISGTSIEGQVPAGTTIGAVTLLGDTSAPGGGFGFLSYGPASTTQPFGFPASMQVKLNFTLTGDGTASFAGQLKLDPLRAPEPMALTLLGTALVGLALLRRRQVS